MNLHSLRFRVTAWSVGFLAVALAIFSVAVYLGVQQFFLASQQRNLRTMTRNIETGFLSNYGRRGENWAVGEIREDIPGGADRYVRILHDGREIYRSNNLHNPPIQISDIPLPDDNVQGVVHLPDIASGMIEVVDRYTSPDGLHFTVITGASEVAAHRVLRSIALILCAVCPIVLVLAAIACFILMARPLHPVLVLTQQAEHIGRDHLGERLHVPATGDELQRLAVALNRMIERLEAALAHNHRFSADASHELRTPLTILRGELEQAIQEPGLSDTATDSIGSALEEIERMSQIVQSLMATAYLDSGGEKIEREPTALGRLVGSTIEQMQLLAEERQITLETDRLAPDLVSVNPTRIKQVVVNLLDNAMKYNRAGGTVTASVFPQNDSMILRVADNGLGIPPASLPFIFDRFYRADKARSRATGGIGIGLSIVKAICNAHSATIDVQSREGQGTVFTIAFPRLAEDSALPALAAAPARSTSSASSEAATSR
jgi:signal transduction histidine kinase